MNLHWINGLIYVFTYVNIRDFFISLYFLISLRGNESVDLWRLPSCFPYCFNLQLPVLRWVWPGKPNTTSAGSFFPLLFYCFLLLFYCFVLFFCCFSLAPGGPQKGRNAGRRSSEIIEMSTFLKRDCMETSNLICSGFPWCPRSRRCPQ